MRRLEDLRKSMGVREQQFAVRSPSAEESGHDAMYQVERAAVRLRDDLDRLAVLCQMQDDIAAADLDLQTIIRLVVECAQHLTGADGASIALPPHELAEWLQARGSRAFAACEV